MFCGAGGAAKGYQRAGFYVVGVDIDPQPNYCGDEFFQLDALALLDTYLTDGEGIPFDAIHASPPCQAYTQTSNRWRGKGGAADNHPDLIGPTRERLGNIGVPWVLENVVGAVWKMEATLILAGAMFGLGVHRPRLFESNTLILSPGRGCRGIDRIGVYGNKPDGRRLNSRTTQRAARSLAEGAEAMGIDWMTWDELREAIPPAYTEWIGRQLIGALADV
jgi:DNA (cytosine-5)-methyltransferase 1